MNEIDIRRFGFATGTTLAMLNLLCLALLLVLGQERLVFLANSFMHGIDITPLVSAETDIVKVIIGVAETFIIGFMAGALIAGIYNYTLR